MESTNGGAAFGRQFTAGSSAVVFPLAAASAVPGGHQPWDVDVDLESSFRGGGSGVDSSKGADSAGSAACPPFRRANGVRRMVTSLSASKTRPSLNVKR